MKLVYNPEPVSVPYAEGRFVDPESWAYVEDEIGDPRLVEVEVPNATDPNTNADSIPAIQEAIEDRKKDRQDDEEEGNREDDRDDAKLFTQAENAAEPQVRNTDSTKRTSTRSTAKNKEA